MRPRYRRAGRRGARLSYVLPPECRPRAASTHPYKTTGATTSAAAAVADGWNSASVTRLPYLTTTAPTADPTASRARKEAPESSCGVGRCLLLKATTQRVRCVLPAERRRSAATGRGAAVDRGARRLAHCMLSADNSAAPTA